MSEEQIVSLEHFETIEKRVSRKLTRKYAMLIWDQTKSEKPDWASELFFWAPEDLRKKSTTAAITLAGVLPQLKDLDWPNVSLMICKDRGGFGAKPILEGYWRHIVDDYFKRFPKPTIQEPVAIQEPVKIETEEKRPKNIFQRLTGGNRSGGKKE